MENRTSNPVFSDKMFVGIDRCVDGETLNGTITKCFILLSLAFMSAIFAWTTASVAPEILIKKSYTFMIIGFIVALITIFKKEWAGFTAPLYAILEGLFLGSISLLFEMEYPGIVFQAILLTFGTAFGMLIAYRSGVIKVTKNFYIIVASAMLGILITYIATWVLGAFNISIPLLHSNGIAGILFNAFVIIIASLNLVISFDQIVSISNKGYPKYIGWFSAFGLTVALIWMYIEILHLLSKIKSK